MVEITVQNPELVDFLQREKKRKKRNTFENRHSGLLAYEQWLDNTEKEIDDINFIDIEDFADWLANDKGNGGLSHRSAELYIQQVNQFYKRRIKEQKQKESENGRVPDSEIITPVDNAELELNTNETEREKQTHDRQRQGLTVEEMNQIIELADSFKRQLVLKCLGGLGCRPSDLQDIRVQDVDLDNNRVKIRSSKTTNNREVPISDSLREYLNLWLNHGYRDGCYYAETTDWLIPGERSEQVGTRTIDKIVYETAGKSELQETIYTSSDGREHQKITAYSFRVGFASHMKKKVSPKELQYLMGHKQIETTLKHYTEVTDDDIDRMQGQVPDI